MGVKEAPTGYRHAVGYKQTDVGLIPKDWDIRRASQIGNPVRGGSPRPAGDSRYFDGSFIPWLTVAALTNIPSSRLVVTGTATCLTEEGALRSRTLFPGTLIIANSGATLGVAKVLGIKCCANDGIAAILSLDKSVSVQYLAHFINTKTNYLREVVATGNGQPNLNTELIGNFQFPFPPTRGEQEAIAEALNDSDALIESLEQFIAKKRQIKRGAMQDLLTGNKRLPGFSDAWKSRPLGELFDFSGGYSASRDQLSSEGHYYLHYGDIHGSSKSFIDVGAESQIIPRLDIPLKRIGRLSLLEDGDVVFVDASEDDEGTSKHLVIVNTDNAPFISGLHTIVAKSKTAELDHGYQRHCFQTADVKQQFRFFAVGTKVSGISKSNIGRITLSVPSIPEQTAIATVLNDMDAEITALGTKLSKALHLKQGMMQVLLTGKIRLI